MNSNGCITAAEASPHEISPARTSTSNTNASPSTSAPMNNIIGLSADSADVLTADGIVPNDVFCHIPAYGQQESNLANAYESNIGLESRPPEYEYAAHRRSHSLDSEGNMSLLSSLSALMAANSIQGSGNDSEPPTHPEVSDYDAMWLAAVSAWKGQGDRENTTPHVEINRDNDPLWRQAGMKDDTSMFAFGLVWDNQSMWLHQRETEVPAIRNCDWEENSLLSADKKHAAAVSTSHVGPVDIQPTCFERLASLEDSKPPSSARFSPLPAMTCFEPTVEEANEVVRGLLSSDLNVEVPSGGANNNMMSTSISLRRTKSMSSLDVSSADLSPSYLQDLGDFVSIMMDHTHNRMSNASTSISHQRSRSMSSFGVSSADLSQSYLQDLGNFISIMMDNTPEGSTANLDKPQCLNDPHDNTQQQVTAFKSVNPTEVRFKRPSHPGTQLWHKAVAVFSGNRQEFPKWKDEYSDKIKDILCKQGIERYLVFRKRKPTTNGSWCDATPKEFIAKSRERFKDDRDKEKGKRGRPPLPAPPSMNPQWNQNARFPEMVDQGDISKSLSALLKSCRMLIEQHEKQASAPSVSFPTLPQAMGDLEYISNFMHGINHKDVRRKSHKRNHSSDPSSITDCYDICVAGLKSFPNGNHDTAGLIGALAEHLPRTIDPSSSEDISSGDVVSQNGRPVAFLKRGVDVKKNVSSKGDEGRSLPSEVVVRHDVNHDDLSQLPDAGDSVPYHSFADPTSTARLPSQLPSPSQSSRLKQVPLEIPEWYQPIADELSNARPQDAWNILRAKLVDESWSNKFSTLNPQEFGGIIAQLSADQHRVAKLLASHIRFQFTCEHAAMAIQSTPHRNTMVNTLSPFCQDWHVNKSLIASVLGRNDRYTLQSGSKRRTRKKRRYPVDLEE